MNNYEETGSIRIHQPLSTRTYFANALPTDGGTTPPNEVFFVDDEVATFAARGEKANALAEVATSANRANFFMMMAMVLLDLLLLLLLLQQHQR